MPDGPAMILATSPWLAALNLLGTMDVLVAILAYLMIQLVSTHHPTRRLRAHCPIPAAFYSNTPQGFSGPPPEKARPPPESVRVPPSEDGTRPEKADAPPDLLGAPPEKADAPPDLPGLPPK